MSVKKKGYAKINIGLDVVGRRSDGYHEVSMIMQDIELCDEVMLDTRIVKGDEPAIRFFMEGETSSSLAGEAEEDNLAVRAAKLLMEEFNITEGLNIYLTKNIPVAAGMAGGSTDAAAVLKGVNEIFNLGLTQEELMERGVRLGADVPYCIMGGTALSEGIGEKLTSISPFKQYFVLLAKPEQGISTPAAYREIDSLINPAHPDIKGLVKAIEDGDENGVISRMANIFEDVTLSERPEIVTLKKLMSDNGALVSLMSGSGPTVFGLYSDQASLKRAYEAVKVSGLARNLIMTKIRSDK